MSPIFIAAGLLLVLRLIGEAGVTGLDHWAEAARWATGLTFIMMGVAHFSPLRRDVIALVPPWIRGAGTVVSVLGLWQLLGGVALLLAGTRRVAAYALLALLAAKFPANVWLSRTALRQRGRLSTSPTWRVPAQLAWICLVWWVGT
jgi:uncharacterized membrane protein